MYRYWAMEIGWGIKTQKGNYEKINEKRWLCFSFSIGASPIYYCLKDPICVFKVNIFLSVLDLCSISAVSQPACQTISPQIRSDHVVSWSSAYEGGRVGLGRWESCSSACWGAGPLSFKPVELWQKHLLWEGSLPTLIRHFFCSRIWWTVIRTFYFLSIVYPFKSNKPGSFNMTALNYFSFSIIAQSIFL